MHMNSVPVRLKPICNLHFAVLSRVVGHTLHDQISPQDCTYCYQGWYVSITTYGNPIPNTI